MTFGTWETLRSKASPGSGRPGHSGKGVREFQSTPKSGLQPGCILVSPGEFQEIYYCPSTPPINRIRIFEGKTQSSVTFKSFSGESKIQQRLRDAVIKLSREKSKAKCYAGRNLRGGEGGGIRSFSLYCSVLLTNVLV